MFLQNVKGESNSNPKKSKELNEIRHPNESQGLPPINGQTPPILKQPQQVCIV